jgi:hypothetical protein
VLDSFAAEVARLTAQKRARMGDLILRQRTRIAALCAAPPPLFANYQGDELLFGEASRAECGAYFDDAAEEGVLRALEAYATALEERAEGARGILKLLARRNAIRTDAEKVAASANDPARLLDRGAANTARWGFTVET